MKRKTPARRSIAVLILFLLLSVSVTISVIAYYVKNTGTVTNTFSPADAVDPTVIEEFDKQIKKNVKISVGNTDYPVYVRAAIVITWIDAEGNTVFGYDGGYTLDLNLNSPNGWTKRSDGYYYFQKPVKSNGETDILINRCEPNGDAGEYTLSVEIIAQTVQAVGSTDTGEIPAYQDAWGISLNDNAP